MSTGDLSAFFGNTAFDPRSVEPQGDFEVIPTGDYPVIIEKAEIKRTKKGDGHYLELALSILDGTFKNRKLWTRFNIDNPNAMAVEISIRTLAALGQAIGLARLEDTTQLLNMMCIACVKVKDNQNEVRTYKPIQQAGGQPTSPYPTQPKFPSTAGVVAQNPGVNQSAAPQAPWMRPAANDNIPY